MFSIFFQFICILLFTVSSDCCGITTHIEISHRAKTYFQGSGAQVDYAKLIQTHNDALMAGSPYPDAYYDDLCANGDYHDVSEDTHWAPFLNATVNYIRAKYPQPWDEATEKLVVFMFGVVSHQVADILWHNLGLDNGFLQAMANINFHGRFDDAHQVGDFGGDILSEYEMDLSYIPIEFDSKGWYIPTDDLYDIYNHFNGSHTHIPKDVITTCTAEIFLERYIPTDDLYGIYLDYYGSEKMPQSIIQECTLTLFIARLAEAIGAKELYRDYADQSPFLLDQFERYYEGGLDDMAGWTDRIWQETITMMEKGTQVCNIPKSTILVTCNSSLPQATRYRDPGRNGYFRRPPLNGVSQKDISIQRTLRGIRLTPSAQFMSKLRKKRETLYYQKKENLKKLQAQETRTKEMVQTETSLLGATALFPAAQLYVKNDYARLGESYAVGDLNFDFIPDLVVTAPGYGSTGSPQEGRVYIIYGTKDGIPASVDLDLDTLESTGQGQILKGWGTAQSRFGASIAVMDINLDGADDIAVGAPAFAEVTAGVSPLEYNGYVLVYFGIQKKRIVANGAANITITCAKVHHCNLGFSLTSGDVDNDGYPDLLMGTPFAPEEGQQRGFVTALLASKNNVGHQQVDVSQLTWKISGDQNTGWFGYDMSFGKWNDQNVLFVSQPQFRKCGFKNCSYVDYDEQSIGQLQAYYGANLTQNWTVPGYLPMYQLGWSADIGSPYPNKSIQVIAVADVGADIYGSIFGEDFYIEQGGRVLLYNSTSGILPEVKKEPKTQIQGDRSFDRFGAKVKFCDVNKDGLSDLIIGSPLRSEDFTELFYGAEQGQVYIYLGGEDFPTKTPCGTAAIHPCPREQADYVLQWQGIESKTRFGSNIGFLQADNQRQVFVTAQHASDYARFGGAVGVFNFR